MKRLKLRTGKVSVWLPGVIEEVLKLSGGRSGASCILKGGQPGGKGPFSSSGSEVIVRNTPAGRPQEAGGMQRFRVWQKTDLPSW